MGKQLRISDETLNQLEILKEPGDTYDRLIKRLLADGLGDKGLRYELAAIALAIRDLTAVIQQISKRG